MHNPGMPGVVSVVAFTKCADAGQIKDRRGKRLA